MGKRKSLKRRSRSGVAILYGKALIFWRSSLQGCIATSSTEAEYVSLSDAGKKIRWLVKESSENQKADFLTKLLSPSSLPKAKISAGLQSVDNEEGR